MDQLQFEKILNELIDIKRLLILNVSKTGATSVEIAKVLGLADSSVRKFLTGNDSRTKKDVSKPKKKSK